MIRRRAATLAALLGAALAAACARAADDGDGLLFPRAPLLIVSIDTLRADRLGCYGSTTGASPELDAFAAQAVRFESAYANSCKTAESHMSLFTSLPVTAHGVTNASARLELPVYEVARNRLTLPQVLRRAGYWNAAVACGGNLMPKMGFARGFPPGRFLSDAQDVSVIVDRGLAALDAGLAQDDPVFLFLHTYQTHGPYVPPEGYRLRFAPEFRGQVGERVQAIKDLPYQQQWAAMNTVFWAGVEHFTAEDAAYLSDLYDGEVAYTDEHFGRLMRGLQERGLLDELIVVVLSDHGEEFAEHGHYEHDQLYEEALRVPLLIRLPGGRLGGTTVTGLTSLLDVMPTLLELLGLQGPEQMMGRSLVPAMLSGRVSERPILAERTMFPGAYMATLRTPGTTVYFREEQGRIEVYDRAADPAERAALPADAASHGPARQALLDQLTALFALRAALDDEATGGTFVLDEATRQQLLELNYTGEGQLPPLPENNPLRRYPAGPGPK